MRSKKTTLPLLFFSVLILLFPLRGTSTAQTPVITGINPASGSTAGTTLVTISGSNLFPPGPMPTVTFDVTAVSALGPDPSGKLLVIAPAHPAGPVNVTVTTSLGPSNSVSFTYVAPPAVTNVSPSKGPTAGGTAVTLTGTGYVAGATVLFGNFPATNVVVSGATMITATTPAFFGVGAVNVRVINPDTQFSTLNNGFTYSDACADVAPPCINTISVDGSSTAFPQIKARLQMFTNVFQAAQVFVQNTNNADQNELDPVLVNAGTPPTYKTISMTINMPSTFSATFAMGAGSLQSWQWNPSVSPRQITVNLQPRPISFSTNCSTASCANQADFDYKAFAFAMVASIPASFSSDPAFAGFLRDIQGAFMSTNAQTFEPPNYDSTTGIFTFKLAATHLTKAGATSIGSFRILVPNSIIINEWGLQPQSLLNLSATKVQAVSGGTTQTITNLTITPQTDPNLGPLGIIFQAEGFSYSVPQIRITPAPTVSDIFLASGSTAGGTPVTITGGNFRAGATVRIGGVPATNVTVVSPTTITAVTAAHAPGPVDVAVTNADGQAATLTGRFFYSTPTVDFNGDGQADLFLYNPNTGLWFRVTNNAGNFTYFTSTWSRDWIVKAGDFNGDGLTDFFLYNKTTGRWFKATNNGAGDFTYFTSLWSPGWDVFVFDLNADGKSDVFLYNKDSGLWFKCFNIGSGDFTYFSGVWSPNWQVSPADLNGDKLGDLFLYNETTGQWFWAINDGGGSFTYKNGVWSPNWRVSPGDFNADGRSDIFLYNPTSGIWFIASSDGVGNFTYTTGSWDPGWTVQIGDFDADGRADLFLYNTAGGRWFEAINNGAGNFSYFTSVWSPSWKVFVTDLNGDRRSDIFLYNETSGLWFQATNTGLGAFAYRSGNWDPGWTIVAAPTTVP